MEMMKKMVMMLAKVKGSKVAIRIDKIMIRVNFKLSAERSVLIDYATQRKFIRKLDQE